MVRGGQHVVTWKCTINNVKRRLPRRWEVSSLRHRRSDARHPVRADLFAVFVCGGDGARVLLLLALCDSVISSIARPAAWARGYSERPRQIADLSVLCRPRPTEGRGAVLSGLYLRLRGK